MTEDRQMLVFKLQDEEVGLDISCVREVLKLQEIHSLPQAPDFVEGVINLRNHIIAVIDLRKRFRLKAASDTSESRILVCSIKKFIAGLIVDSVSGIVSISEKQIDPTPDVVSRHIANNCFSGLVRCGERVIVLLDLQKLLDKDEEKDLFK